jgi:GrpB-like predicted nucleotidyltransferase (UPF0157 family)
VHPSQEPVVVEPYQPLWRVQFAGEQNLLRTVLGNNVRDIQHFGSTSVPDLWAKPTVDILAGTCCWPWPTQLDLALQGAGYVFYKAPNERWRVYLKPWRDKLRGYHLHVVEFESDHWNEHLLFRDYLRCHPQDAERYAESKRELAGQLEGRRGSYQRLKAELVVELMERAKAWKS